MISVQLAMVVWFKALRKTRFLCNWQSWGSSWIHQATVEFWAISAFTETAIAAPLSEHELEITQMLLLVALSQSVPPYLQLF